MSEAHGKQVCGAPFNLRLVSGSWR